MKNNKIIKERSRGTFPTDFFTVFSNLYEVIYLRCKDKTQMTFFRKKGCPIIFCCIPIYKKKKHIAYYSVSYCNETIVLIHLLDRIHFPSNEQTFIRLCTISEIESKNSGFSNIVNSFVDFDYFYEILNSKEIQIFNTKGIDKTNCELIMKCNYNGHKKVNTKNEKENKIKSQRNCKYFVNDFIKYFPNNFERLFVEGNNKLQMIFYKKKDSKELFCCVPETSKKGCLSYFYVSVIDNYITLIYLFSFYQICETINEYYDEFIKSRNEKIKKGEVHQQILVGKGEKIKSFDEFQEIVNKSKISIQDCLTNETTTPKIIIRF